jgi:hypothetical protein
MFIEYYRKRKSTIGNEIVYHEGNGMAFEIEYKKVVEIPDAMAFRVISAFPDIIRQVKTEQDPAEKTRAKSRRTKDVTTFETA